MRLTLRALLAYLNNVLDPADADEFAGKVKESAVASGLVQRIGGITHKMRMNAPRIDAKGTADDANTVAEYLDNSLPEERVADFERTCINSDMHLAEVASSYQILTMVLGKPADIPEAMKTRIYTLPLELAIAHRASDDGDAAERQRLKKTMEKVAQSAKETDAGMQSVRTGSTHAVAEVPPYLREGQKSPLLWWLAAAAVFLGGIAIGIRAVGPYDSTNPIIGGFFKPAERVAQGNRSGDETSLPSGTNVQDSTGDKTTSTDKSADTTSDKVVAATPDVKDAADSEKTATEDKTTDKSPASVKDGDKTTDDAAATKPEPPMPPVEPETPAISAKGSDTKGTAKSASTDAKSPDAGATKPAPPVDPMDVGRYASDDQVLTRFDEKPRLWIRVPSRAILAAGERLVVLPTYRPQIALASGVQVTFAGDSAVQMEEPLHPGASRMTVFYGRFLAATLGNEGAQLELNLQGLQGVLTLVDSDTVVAIDVRQYLPPGASDEKDERLLVIEMFATNGSARWEEAGQEPKEIPMHHVLTYVAGSERELTGPFASPEWIDASSLPEIDRLTSHELQRVLELEKPIHVQLQERMGDRRVDVRALAARCLASLGEFEPLIKELGNPQQKSFWAPEVDVLRQSLSRGPQAAELIRQSLERLRPKEASTLYRILQGYSSEQLAGSGATELVEFLDNPEMDVRVLASDTLRQITGAQLLYRPEKPPSENRGSINRWIERQKDGSITYKTAPSPLTERKPLAMPPAETKAPAAKNKEGK